MSHRKIDSDFHLLLHHFLKLFFPSTESRRVKSTVTLGEFRRVIWTEDTVGCPVKGGVPVSTGVRKEYSLSCQVTLVQGKVFYGLHQNSFYFSSPDYFVRCQGDDIAQNSGINYKRGRKALGGDRETSRPDERTTLICLQVGVL